MADVKISALPAATTPLAGTEVLPIVQSSTTKKVAISDVTAGRAISASSLTLTTTPLAVGSGGTGTGTAFTAGSVVFAGASGTYSQDNANLFWDDTNNRLGIGSSNPGGAIGDERVRITGTDTNGWPLAIEDSAGTVASGFYAANNIAGVGNFSADPFIFLTQNTEKMRLDASGNLGLGAAPTNYGGGYTGFWIQGSTGGVIDLSTAGTRVGTFLNTSTDVTIGSISTVPFIFKTSNTERMRIASDGSVGIGTASPSQKLHVYGNILSDTASATNYYAQVAGTTYTQFLTTASATTLKTIAANPLILGTNDTERARIDSSGNVIINTAAIATTATDGFLYVPTCAGTPTGTPTTYTGRAPIVVNTTNNKLYFYSGGAWRDAGP